MLTQVIHELGRDKVIVYSLTFKVKLFLAFLLHSRTFYLLIPMHTQVTMIIITQHLVDLVENSESVVILLSFRRKLLLYFSLYFIGYCGVYRNINLSIIDAL